MKFTPVAAGELYSNHVTEADGLRLTALAHSAWRDPPETPAKAALEAALARADTRLPVVAAFDTGWFVEVGAALPQDHAEVRETNEALFAFYRAAGFGLQFQVLVTAAQAAGLQYLRVHADADPTPELTTYDW